MKRIVCLMLALAATTAAAQYGLFTGYARDPQTGALLYVESHYVKDLGAADEQRIVLYRCAKQGPVFARKQLNYARQRFAPEFRFDDGRLGYTEGLRRQGGNTEVYLRETADSAERSARLSREKSARRRCRVR